MATEAWTGACEKPPLGATETSTRPIDGRKRRRFEVESTNQRGETVMVGETIEQAL